MPTLRQINKKAFLVPKGMKNGIGKAFLFYHKTFPCKREGECYLQLLANLVLVSSTFLVSAAGVG